LILLIAIPAEREDDENDEVLPPAQHIPKEKKE
jgi:hypothetical protein